MPITPPPIDAFPWQSEALRSALAGCATLPHALLISSAPGYGAGQFASALAAALLCESGAVLADAKACGHCAACGWMLAGHHPDFRLLGLDTGEEEGAVAGDGAAESESGEAALIQGRPSCAELPVDWMMQEPEKLCQSRIAEHQNVPSVHDLRLATGLVQAVH